MNILIPLEITAAMVQPGTSIASPDPAMGEVAWAASAAYVVGDERVSALADKQGQVIRREGEPWDCQVLIGAQQSLIHGHLLLIRRGRCLLHPLGALRQVPGPRKAPD